jgi:DNA-directed RNA polymerase subunit RPC12/RpoP
MKEIIGHCPYCTKVLFKDASFKDEADFETNCHHCGKPILVQVEKQIIVRVKPMIKVKLRPARRD